jgi:hypothetical protein
MVYGDRLNLISSIFFLKFYDSLKKKHKTLLRFLYGRLPIAVKRVLTSLPTKYIYTYTWLSTNFLTSISFC